MMAAEQIWLSRWKGKSPRELASVRVIPSLEDLQLTWEPLRTEMLDFVAGIRDPNHLVVYRNTKGSSSAVYCGL